MYLKSSRDRFFANPRPADWIEPMTVCIAGMCSNDTIIAMCDMMISTDYFSADNMALKFRDIHKDWKVMFAGNDISRVIPLVGRAVDILRGGTGLSRTAVEAAMRTAFQEQLIEKQTDIVLARYGLTMPQFVTTGLSTFGEAIFSAMKYQLDQTQLDCSFLVFGRDEVGDAHIFTIEDPGIACNHDLYGFWAIGSGANRALSSLFFQQYNVATPEWRAIYCIAEAKFMAEGGSVGDKTLVLIKRKDGSSVASLSLQTLKTLWHEKGRPRIPTETEKAVAECLAKDFVELSPIKRADK
jgi:hypothetical protein